MNVHINVINIENRDICLYAKYLTKYNENYKLIKTILFIIDYVHERIKKKNS